MSDHDLLIDALAGDARPVRRPAPVAGRALAWAAVCLASGWIATGALHASWASAGLNGVFGGVELAASLAAGLMLMVAALEISIAGRRSPALPVAALCAAAWAAVSTADLALAGWPVGRIGEGSFCFRFVLLASAPMAVAMVFAVRRTYAVRPARTMLLGAVSIGFLSLALLTLCHHGRLHLLDFSMHLAAVALVIAASTALGWRLVAIPRGTGRAWA